MKKILFLISLLVALVFASCSRPHKPLHVTSVHTEALKVDSSCDAIQDTAYLARLAPVKAVVDKEMNVKVGYVPQTLWVGAPECPLLNWLTDALWDAAKANYPGTVDAAIVNMGSVRGEWREGDLTYGQIYTVMPFENKLVVIALTGNDMIELCDSFASYGPQGVAGMRVTIVDEQVADIQIGGQPVNPKKTYHVATSDYLTGGADHMTALTRYSELWNSEMPIRDLYIRAAKEQDTIRAAVDGRMTIL